MSATATLVFAPGRFFGGSRLSLSSHGVSVSHRIADCAPEEVIDHTHQDAHFILVTGGGYMSAAAGRPAPGGPDLIYNPPGTTHRDRFVRGRGSFFAISLDPVKAASLTAASTPDEPVYLASPVQHAIARRIAGCCASQVSGLSLESLCAELLGSMDPQAGREAQTPPSWLQAALDLLHDRFVEDLTIADIAAAVGVHPIHLARCFRRHFRCTPAEFARFRRLEKATDLLTRTTRPLVEVAHSCGFADQSHLSRVLTRSLGLTPGQYRRLAGDRAAGSCMFQIDKNGSASWVKLHAWAKAARASARRWK
jgi:AraC family transcriptional regulator